MPQRNTVQKELVLSAVMQLKGSHPTADEVYAKVCESHAAVSKATVYRNLALLSEGGTIVHLKVPHGADRFDVAHATHQHLHCTQCGEVKDVNFSSFAPLIEEVQTQTGYSLRGAQIVLGGICAACSGKNK